MIISVPDLEYSVIKSVPDVGYSVIISVPDVGEYLADMETIWSKLQSVSGRRSPGRPLVSTPPLATSAHWASTWGGGTNDFTRVPFRHKLDGVGPIDNRASTDKLNHFVKKKKLTCYMSHVTHDT